MKTWIAIDCGDLCWRAFHSTGGLEYEGVKTGVIFGFLKEVLRLQEYFQSNDVIFAFDRKGAACRRAIYEGYKKRRHTKELTEEEIALRADMDRQMKRLRKTYLPSMGFKNVFSQNEREADDIIGSIAQNLPEGDRLIIVSGDRDYYQLISKRVFVYDPKKRLKVTKKVLMKMHGVSPMGWLKMMTIAGCSTDEVPGVPRVGKETALKYVRGELPEHHKTFQAITSADGRKIKHRNRKLVTLPFPDTKIFNLRKNRVNADSWSAACIKIGAKSLKNLYHGY